MPELSSSKLFDDADIFFMTAGLGLDQDYKWRGDKILSLPSYFDEMSEVLDGQEPSWALKRVSERGSLILMVYALPSSRKDMQLSRIRNCFAIELPEHSENAMRGILIELFESCGELALRIDQLVSVAPEDGRFGWTVQFEDFRSLLRKVCEKHKVDNFESHPGRRLYVYSSDESKKTLAEELRRGSLPRDREWIIICNPIAKPKILRTDAWAVATSEAATWDDQTDSSTATNFPRLSQDELLIAAIIVGVMVGVWFFVRRR